MKKLGTFLLMAALSASALAQDRQFLSRPEVEALAAGRKWIHVRADDRNNVRWDLRNGGTLYGNNYTVNQSDSGTWSVNDQGQLCVKWRGRSANRCVAVAKNGDKYLMVDSQNLAGSYAELTVE